MKVGHRNDKNTTTPILSHSKVENYCHVLSSGFSMKCFTMISGYSFTALCMHLTDFMHTFGLIVEIQFGKL